MRLVVLGAVIALFTGCIQAHTTTGNYPLKHAAKPANCGARILRLQPKDDVEEVGSVLLEGSVFVTPSDAEVELTERACRLGADAAVITYERYAVPFVGTQVQAVFVKVRDATSGAAQPVAL